MNDNSLTLSLNRRLQFTLATILLVMTLAAVWLLMLRYSVWLALAGTLVLPAPVRALVVWRHRQLKGETLAGQQFVELLVTSLYAAILTWLITLLVMVATTYLTDLALSPWKASFTPQTLVTDLAYMAGLVVSLPVYLLVFWGFTFVERELP
jgi:hypothetical protein